MNTALGLRVLGHIMDWDDDKAHDEFRRLRLLAALKYDGYRDFEAGVRFIESLAAWLQQFSPTERPTAYEFVVERLVYVGPGEMEKLVAQLYTNVVRPNLVRSVATELNIPPYLINSSQQALDLLDLRRRKTLFLGLSDGARVDYIRHQNVGLIRNEQVVGSAQLDSAKWGDLLLELRRETGDADARFEAVYLIDDFTATGTSFFRVDPETGKVKGKLCKFAQSVESAREDLGTELFDASYALRVHHYVGSAAAVHDLEDRLLAEQTQLEQLGITQLPVLTFGIVLPDSLPLSGPADSAFLELIDKYYDPALETEHTAVGGTVDMKLGYGGCGLPVVLDHNTPNNSVPLIWAETAGSKTEPSAPAMRPLFRRRQRHP